MWSLKKKPEGATEMTNIELLQGTEQWSGNEGGEGNENNFGAEYPEPSQVVAAPPPAKSNTSKRTVVLVALLGIVGGLGAFLATEDGGHLLDAALNGEIFSGASGEEVASEEPEEGTAEDSVQVPPPVDATGSSPAPAMAPPAAPTDQLPGATAAANASNDTEPLSNEGTPGEGEVAEEEIEEEEKAAPPPSFKYVRVGVVGENSHEKAWLALERLSEWRQSGQHDPNVLLEYFAHGKLWVRLAALEVAVAQKALGADEIHSAAKDIHDTFRADQIRRWLKRVAVRDASTFEAMKKMLGV